MAGSSQNTTAREVVVMYPRKTARLDHFMSVNQPRSSDRRVADIVCVRIKMRRIDAERSVTPVDPRHDGVVYNAGCCPHGDMEADT
jgi:broad specificity polyphosphatase/5'/3'-nucleotidase SurE